MDDAVYVELMKVQSELQKSERFCLRCIAQMEGRPVSASSVSDVLAPAHIANDPAKDRATTAMASRRPRVISADHLSMCFVSHPLRLILKFGYSILSGPFESAATSTKDTDLIVNGRIVKGREECSDTPTPSASKMWKVFVEVGMEDVLCLLKTKLPVHCSSPTLFRRRFRSLFNCFFDSLDVDGESVDPHHLRWLFLAKEGDTGLWTPNMLEAVRYAISYLYWDGDKKPATINVAECLNCEQIRLLFLSLCDTVLDAPSIPKFISSSTLPLQSDRCAVAETLVGLVFRVGSENSGADLDPTLERYMPLLTHKVVSPFVRSQSHTTLTTGEAVSAGCFKNEWFLLLSILQSLYDVDTSTVFQLVYALDLKEVDVVLFLSFLFVVRSCQARNMGVDNLKTVSTGIMSPKGDVVGTEYFVDWVQALFEPSTNAKSHETVQNGLDFDKPQLETNIRPVEDVLLQQFFDMYSTRGISYDIRIIVHAKLIVFLCALSDAVNVEDLLNGSPGLESAVSTTSRRTILHTAVMVNYVIYLLGRPRLIFPHV